MAARERQPDVLRLRGVQNVLVLRPSPSKHGSDRAPYQPGKETQRERKAQRSSMCICVVPLARRTRGRPRAAGRGR
jgi:hypothetical protein